MRNLHHDGIRFDTPFLLEILHNLGIEVSPDKHKQPLRRFLIGQLMTPMNDCTRSEVKRNTQIPACFDYSGGIESVFSQAQDYVVTELLKNGIRASQVKEIHLSNDPYFNGPHYDVEYLSFETDAELSERQEKADMFNLMLAHKNEIYAQIDTVLGREKAVKLTGS